MGNTQVTSLHPVQVAGDLRSPLVVKNVSSPTIYYRANPFVSSATKDGELAENEEVTITNATWFVTEKPVDGEIRVTPGVVSFIATGNLEPDSVTESKIGPEAIDEDSIKAGAVATAKLASGAVTASKVAVAPALPVPGSEKEIVVAAEFGVLSKIVAAITGDNAKTAWKIKHSINTQGCVAFALKSASKLPTEQPTTSLGKWVNESTTEGTYTFTAAPAAKEELFILVIG